MQWFSTQTKRSMWEDCEEVTLHMDTPSLKVSSERKEKKKILVSAKELSKCRSFPNQNDTFTFSNSTL